MQHEHLKHFMGRHRGGHGFGRFAGGFGERDGQGGGLRLGRKLAAGDLQLVLMALLAERPSHGYELIKALDERSGGFYSPSPGMVYPALTYLEEVGHASVSVEGNKKCYALTDEGSAHLERNRAAADAMLAQLQRIGERMSRVRSAFGGDDGDGDERNAPELRRAIHTLKAALRDKHGSGPAELRRIVEILARATAEIRSEPS